MHARLMWRLLAQHRRAPDARLTRVLLFLAKFYALLVLRPVTYFRVIKIAQGGSVWKTIGLLPTYARVGFSVYLGLFRDAREA